MADYSMYPAPDLDDDGLTWPKITDWWSESEGCMVSATLIDVLAVAGCCFLLWLNETYNFIRYVLPLGTATSRPLTISEPCVRPVFYPTYRRTPAARVMTGAGSVLAPPVGWFTPTGCNTP